MHRIQGFVLLVLLLHLTNGLSFTQASAAPWPEGYIVHEGSKSPNGRYGVLVQTTERGAESDDDTPTHLADIQAHESLGVIRGGTYFQGQNRRHLHVSWAPASDWGVVMFEGRFGFDGISLLELGGAGFTETDIDKHLHSKLNSTIGKCEGDPNGSGEGPAYFRILPDRRLQVRAAATNNPKAFEDKKTCCSFFQGTFDLKAKRWSVTDTRAIGLKDFDGLHAVYGESDFENSTFTSDEDREAFLDRTMNEVYGFLRAILPTKRFAKVKKEQIEWLKTRDAAEPVAEKCRLLEGRIKSLRELAW